MPPSDPVRPPSCADDYDPASLPANQAMARINEQVTPITATEQVALRCALGRIAAADITAPFDVPTHTNSAMDGYALAASDLPATGSRHRRLIGTAWAGRPFDGVLGAGECVRIMTGAPLPAGADTVIMQEQVERTDNGIRFEPGQRRGQHVRYAGEDMRRGALTLAAGTRIGPAELGLVASLGIGEVRVTRRPRVTFFSTGDELRAIGEPLGAGDVYDSNRYTLYGMLTRLGVELHDLGVVLDQPEAVRQAFRDAAAGADAVVTSAGASVGDADFIQQTLAELGRVDFWKIAMRPGRPLAFGKLGAALFFGLPGNPVSVMVTFHQLVAPALRRLMGERHTPALRLAVRCADGLKKTPGRMELQRGIVQREPGGELVVHSTGGQGSAILNSMSLANCFIILPADSGNVAAGSLVDIELFGELL